MQLGLIAGGLVDGTVNLWNPAKIVGAVGSEEPADAADDVLVASLQKHTGAVRSCTQPLLRPPCGVASRHRCARIVSLTRHTTRVRDATRRDAGQRPAVQPVQPEPAGFRRRGR
jgi:hypothetical protein